jgi:hypothetical protein
LVYFSLKSLELLGFVFQVNLQLLCIDLQFFLYSFLIIFLINLKLFLGVDLCIFLDFFSLNCQLWVFVFWIFIFLILDKS